MRNLLVFSITFFASTALAESTLVDTASECDNFLAASAYSETLESDPLLFSDDQERLLKDFEDGSSIKPQACRTVYGNDKWESNGFLYMNAAKNIPSGDPREACGTDYTYKINRSKVRTVKFNGVCFGGRRDGKSNYAVTYCD